jgi:cytochrome c556
MKVMKLLVPALLASAVFLGAQDNGPMEAWMKSINQNMGSLRKMDPKTGPEAVKAAETVAGHYEEMIGFWRQRNADDAVKLSEAGKAAAVELASAAKAGEAEKATAAMARVGDTCKGCHAAHRDRTPEGKYIIK